MSNIVYRRDRQRGSDESTGHQPARADAGVEPAGDQRRHHHAERLRKRGQAAGQRRHAAQQLQVQRHHEGDSEEAADGEEADEVALPEHSVAEQPQVEHRDWDAQLDDRHGDCREHAQRPAGDHQWRRPAGTRALAERVNDQRQRRAGEHEAGDVESAAGRLPMLLKVTPAEPQRDDARSAR